MSIKYNRVLLVSGLLASAALSTHAFGQTAASAASAPASSDSAMLNLVRLLIEQKVLSPKKGAALMAQALAEADARRRSDDAARLAAATPPPAPAPATPAAAADLPAPAPGSVRVAYVPEAVREAIKDDLRKEVMQQARDEGWAARGDAAPDWTRRITISGDLRFRSESDLYSKSNSDQILNYAAMNQAGPYNMAGTAFPYLDTREDHINVMKVRARLNVGFNIAKGVDGNFQIATGDTNSPISTQSILGGGFGKRDAWVQQAWLRLQPSDSFGVTVGRMPDPFLHSELLFENEVAFDGVVAQASKYHLFGSGIDAQLRGGAFPLDFGDPNFPSTSSAKAGVPQKWLFAAQTEWHAPIGDKLRLTAAAGYFDFVHTQGQLSQPCFTGAGQVNCSTDDTVPLFLGKGNTLSYVRQLATLNGATLTSLPQYFAPTFKYQIINVNGTISYDLGQERYVDLNGDFIHNAGLHRSDICRNGVYGEPFNNGGAEGGDASICDPTASGGKASWAGGRDGWQGMLRVGNRQPSKWGEWQFEAGYRRIASDAMLDSLTDADMHLGGTNYKGYFVGAQAGVFNNMSLALHWYSASQITAEPFAIDVLEVDLNARF